MKFKAEVIGHHVPEVLSQQMFAIFSSPVIEDESDDKNKPWDGTVNKGQVGTPIFKKAQ